MASHHSNSWTRFSVSSDCLTHVSNKPAHTLLFSPVSNPISYEIKIDSPLERTLTETLRRIIETGYFQYSERRAFFLIHAFARVNRTQTYSGDGASFSAVTFEKISPYFYLFGIGIAIAMVAFFAELMCCRHKRQPKKKLRYRHIKIQKVQY